VLASAWLHAKGVSIAGVYTYGQPLLCYDDFAEKFQNELSGKLFRFINQLDPIPRLPPRLSRYTHIPVPKRIRRNGDVESKAGGSQTIEIELCESDFQPLTDSEFEELLRERKRNPDKLDEMEASLELQSEHESAVAVAGATFLSLIVLYHGIARYIKMLKKVK